MNFFKLFRIDPEEKFKNALDIVFDGKEFEYKYLYFPILILLRYILMIKLLLKSHIEYIHIAYILNWKLLLKKNFSQSMK